MMICAALDYLAQHGVPEHPDALMGHQLVGFATSARIPWRFRIGEAAERLSGGNESI